jgi:hypothetical protein
MLVANTARSTEPWPTRYEDLRRQVLEEGSAPGCGGWGRALLIRHGMAAWMKAWPQRATVIPPGPNGPPTPILSEPSIPALLRPQATHILVAMILATRQEVLA